MRERRKGLRSRGFNVMVEPVSREYLEMLRLGELGKRLEEFNRTQPSLDDMGE